MHTAVAADRRVLFVSHQASRTGAPLVLLHLLQWLQRHTTLPFEILLRSDGELHGEFAALAPVWTLKAGWPLQPGWRQAAAALHDRRLLARLARTGTGLVYSNTITNGPLLPLLTAGGRPALCHVHELEMIIQHFGPKNFDAVRRCTRRYIACSQAVKDNLVLNHALDAGVIDVVHEFVPTASIAQPPRRRRNEVLAELGIPADSLIVGASGTIEWRKAPDLFVQLAAAIGRRRPGLPVQFVWVGGATPADVRVRELLYDVRGLGMDGRVHFLGARSQPADYFSIFDVFVLTSREDPYPLVCLEAAALQKPIVCFDGAGGEKEFVEDDCGFVVPYHDVEAMADRCVLLLESAELRARLGVTAAGKARIRHDVTVAAPQILKIIEAL